MTYYQKLISYAIKYMLLKEKFLILKHQTTLIKKSMMNMTNIQFKLFFCTNKVEMLLAQLGWYA